MRILFLLIFTLISNYALASMWQVRTSYTDLNTDNISKSVIELTKDQVVLKYIPSETPFGVGPIRRFRLNDKHYFLTVWPFGPTSFKYRVFVPDAEESGNIEPTCEMLSFRESPSMELKDDNVIIQVTDYDQKREQFVELWKKCG